MIRDVLAAVVLAVLSGAGGWLWGHHLGAADVKQAWAADSARREATLRQVQASQALQSGKIVVQYESVARDLELTMEPIVEQVPIYVSAKADSACVVPRGFERVHDAAAQGVELPAAAASIDAAPSGIALSTVTRTVADNYATCHQTRAQLIALQQWASTMSGSAL